MIKDQRRRLEWAVYLLVGTFAIVFLFLATFVLTEGSINSLLISLSSEFLGVAIIFFIVRQFFLGRPEEEVEQKLDELTAAFKKWGGGASVQVLPTRTSIYDSGINMLRSQQWEKLRIFAPVGLWREDADKLRWLEEVAGSAKLGNVKAVWAVFGLPPVTKGGDNRPVEEVREDLLHAKIALSAFEGLSNVIIHFYPPFPASVGLGTLIFENTPRTGGDFALALAVHAHEETVDTGLVIKNDEVFFAVREWFDEQIFWKTTGRFVLHDASIGLSQRWNGIIRDWYGSMYVEESPDTV